MDVRNLNIEEFNEFQKEHPLSNLYQTINYGMLKAENGYDYELVGLIDSSNTIVAASLILIKSINAKYYYGYAPRGFLLDFQNEDLVKIFTEKLKEYFYTKNIIFIKLNPNIPIGIVNNQTFETLYNENYKIKNIISQYGYKKLADNLYFEAQLPRFNAIINLTNSSFNNFNKNTKNKVKKAERKGLKWELGNKNDIIYLEQLIEKKHNHEYYYQDYYTVYEKDNDIKLFLVSIDYDSFLKNTQDKYEIELAKNTKLNEKMTKHPSEKNINAKMNSDKVLLCYKNDIMEATKSLTSNSKKYIAAALVIKHQNTAHIIVSAYDKNYKRFVPNYFLYHNIIEYYKDKAEYLNLDGVVGDFKNANIYSGLNRFKMGFKPDIYEYLGEYDLIINSKMYDVLLHNGSLQKEFKK